VKNWNALTRVELIEAMEIRGIEIDDDLVKRQLLKVFGEIDEQSTGTIHVDDIRSTLRTFGLGTDGLGGVDKLLREACHGEDHISYDEFTEMFLRLHRDAHVSRVAGAVADHPSFTAGLTDPAPPPIRVDVAEASETSLRSDVATRCSLSESTWDLSSSSTSKSSSLAWESQRTPTRGADVSAKDAAAEKAISHRLPEPSPLSRISEVEPFHRWGNTTSAMMQWMHVASMGLSHVGSDMASESSGGRKSREERV